MTATNTHTSSAKKKVSLFHPLPSGWHHFSSGDKRFLHPEGPFWLPYSPFPILWKRRLRQGVEAETAQVWLLSFSVVRVNHPLIWGSHCAPNRQGIDLHRLCSWSRADVRWCAEMMRLSRIHPVLLHPTGTPVSSFITFISYAWWSSSLSPQILSLYHLLCAQEPPSLI